MRSDDECQHMVDVEEEEVHKFMFFSLFKKHEHSTISSTMSTNTD
jgi:hypothetical protein